MRRRICFHSTWEINLIYWTLEIGFTLLYITTITSRHFRQYCINNIVVLKFSRIIICVSSLLHFLTASFVFDLFCFLRTDYSHLQQLTNENRVIFPEKLTPQRIKKLTTLTIECIKKKHTWANNVSAGVEISPFTNLSINLQNIMRPQKNCYIFITQYSNFSKSQ